jgi:hypothetical protein
MEVLIPQEHSLLMDVLDYAALTLIRPIDHLHHVLEL